jgi:carbamoyltransferase
MKPRISDTPCANKATRPEAGLGLLHGTGNEVLAAGNCILPKDEQNLALARDYKNAFESD